MIITRTPFRISFVGGGTDLRNYYAEDDGAVLSTSIDKFIYVVVKRQIGIVEYKYRVNWSKVEFCNSIDEIEHPIVRAALKLFNIDFSVEITTLSDIPGQTGLGSSSAFAVGLVHALHALKGEMVTKHTIASEAAEIEVDILGRTMGKQDHFASAYGDLNVLSFRSDERVVVDPVLYRGEVKKELERKLMLFYTYKKRNASEVLKVQSDRIEINRSILSEMKLLVDPLREVIASGENLVRVGEILDYSWYLKKQVTNQISSDEIDNYYQLAKSAGAVGGKLLGAGGGGFLIFYVEESNQQTVLEALSDLYHLPFSFDDGGTRITYYDQTSIMGRSTEEAQPLVEY